MKGERGARGANRISQCKGKKREGKMIGAGLMQLVMAMGLMVYKNIFGVKYINEEEAAEWEDGYSDLPVRRRLTYH